METGGKHHDWLLETAVSEDSGRGLLMFISAAGCTNQKSTCKTDLPLPASSSLLFPNVVREVPVGSHPHHLHPATQRPGLLLLMCTSPGAGSESLLTGPMPHFLYLQKEICFLEWVSSARITFIRILGLEENSEKPHSLPCVIVTETTERKT